MAAGKVSTPLAEVLLVALIAFSLLFDALLHRLESWINRRHPHLRAATRVLYRELMLLGVVSFLFLVYETVARPRGATVLSFEFAHVFIFLLAVFYTVVVVAAMAASLRMSARWKRMERVDLQRYVALKCAYDDLRARIRDHAAAPCRLLPWWFPSLARMRRFRALHEFVAFHDIRFQLIYFRRLPEHVRIASLLRRVKSATFLQLVDTHWSLRLIMLAVILIDIVRRALTRDRLSFADVKTTLRAAPPSPAAYEPDALTPAFIIAAAFALFLFCQLLSVKINRIYWELAKHPRVYLPAAASPLPQPQPTGHDLPPVPPHATVLTLPVPSDEEVGACRGSTSTSTSPSASDRDDRAASSSPALCDAAARRPPRRKRATTSGSDAPDAPDAPAAPAAPAAACNRAEEEAPRAAARQRYPALLVRLVPALGRERSAAEQLFWLASHRLFLYCVELTLFFSTVLVAAALASLALLLLHGRALTAVHVASFALPPLTLASVLLRIAGIIKRYVFVIHNAELAPGARGARGARRRRLVGRRLGRRGRAGGHGAAQHAGAVLPRGGARRARDGGGRGRGGGRGLGRVGVRAAGAQTGAVVEGAGAAQGVAGRERDGAAGVMRGGACAVCSLLWSFSILGTWSFSMAGTDLDCA